MCFLLDAFLQYDGLQSIMKASTTSCGLVSTYWPRTFRPFTVVCILLCLANSHLEKASSINPTCGAPRVTSSLPSGEECLGASALSTYYHVVLMKTKRSVAPRKAVFQGGPFQTAVSKALVWQIPMVHHFHRSTTGCASFFPGIKAIFRIWICRFTKFETSYTLLPYLGILEGFFFPLLPQISPLKNLIAFQCGWIAGRNIDALVSFGSRVVLD